MSAKCVLKNSLMILRDKSRPLMQKKLFSSKLSFLVILTLLVSYTEERFSLRQFLFQSFHPFSEQVK